MVFSDDKSEMSNNYDEIHHYKVYLIGNKNPHERNSQGFNYL